MVLSAYSKELQLMLSIMSTIYKLKSTGPNMQRCGTPKLLTWVDEVLSSNQFVRIVVVLKYSSELTLRL